MDTKSKIKRLVHNSIKRHGKSFSLFTIIGIFKSVLSIWLSWLFIDILKLGGLIGSTIVTVIAFFITYFTYMAMDVIHREFVKYTIITILFGIANILFIWALVDWGHISGALSSFIVIVILFVARYMLFSKMELIKYG